MLPVKQETEALRVRCPTCPGFVKQYALTYGQKFASSLGYVPLPANVIKKVAAADGISSEYKISVTSK